MAEIKYTKHLLSKIEEVLEELEYKIRYAKGTFQSGYCIVEHQKVAVINKFYETEGRINVLIDILDRLKVDESTLSEKGQKTYKQVMKNRTGKEEDQQEEIKSETEKEEDA